MVATALKQSGTELWTADGQADAGVARLSAQIRLLDPDDGDPPSLRRPFSPLSGAARRSLRTILEWDFDRIIVTHADIVETGGKAKMKKAFAFILDPS